MSTPSSTARVGRAAASHRMIRPAFVGQAVLIGATLAVYGLVLLGAGLHQQDVDAYLKGARDLVDGHPLYATFLQHPFPDPTLRPAYIYPPAFALLMAPLGLLPQWAAVALWTIINQAALVAAVALAITWLHPSRWALAAMVAATATFYPLWIDAVQGQANLLILLLVSLGFFGVARGRDGFAAAFGVAAALKLTPALLLLWLLVDRRWRAGASMVAGFAAVSAIGALVRFDDTVVFVSRVLPALAHGTALYANQSLGGFLSRVATSNPYTEPWTVLPVPVLLGLLAAGLLGWWAWRTMAEPAANRGLAFLPLLPLFSAVTWPHHLVILLPLIWAGIATIDRRQRPWLEAAVGVAILLVFSVLSRLSAGPGFGQPGFRTAQTSDPLVVLTGNALLLGTLAIFLAGPWLLRSR